MRTGFVSFGEPLDTIAPLIATLGERDRDIIAPLDEPASIREQALRLGRADCDGVIFSVGEGAVALLVAEAALHVGCPILLIGDSSPAQADAWNVLAQLPLLFDALFPNEAAADRVEQWLHEVGKTARQGGEGAAAKLYGTRLFVGTENSISPDSRMNWLTQFGILVSSATAPDDPRENDLFAMDDSPEDALTRRLLELVSGTPEMLTVDSSAFLRESSEGKSAIFTFTQIEEYLPRRFSAFVFLGEAQSSGVYAIGALPMGTLKIDSKSPRFFAVAGDFVGALRAVCHALDISVRVLHDR